LELITNLKYCKTDANQAKNDVDQLVIGAIKEALSCILTSIASKLSSSEYSRLKDLSVEDQNLWRQFDNSEIYKFIIGEPDNLVEFQYNWIEP